MTGASLRVAVSARLRRRRPPSRDVSMRKPFDLGPLHPLHHLGNFLVRQHSALRSRKHRRVSVKPRQGLQHRHRLSRQRHTMFMPHLHARAWNGPQRGNHIHVAPHHAPHLAGTRRGQARPGRHGRAPLQIAPPARRIGWRKGGLMFRLRHRARFDQHFRQIASPAGRCGIRRRSPRTGPFRSVRAGASRSCSLRSKSVPASATRRACRWH